MKISSRPQPSTADVQLGTGKNVLNLTDEQLELVTALMCSCRLGHQPYATAAYEVIEMIEEQFGSDWMYGVTDKVDPHVTVEDHSGSVVFASVSGIHHITLEV